MDEEPRSTDQSSDRRRAEVRGDEGGERYRSGPGSCSPDTVEERKHGGISKRAGLGISLLVLK